MTDEHKIARFDVSHELLLAALGLPAETEILDARPSMEYPHALTLKVRHADLMEVPRGQCIPRVCPVIRTEIDQYGREIKRLLSWGPVT